MNPAISKKTRLRALHNQTGRLERRLAHWHRFSARWSWLRLSLFAVSLLAVSISYFLVGGWLAAICALAGGVLFGLTVYAHRRLEIGIARFEVWLRIKSAHIARAQLDWDHLPAPPPFRPRPDHPFEADLDLVGQRSLHHLLDTAVSREGSRRLRDWLTAPVPDPQRSLLRQDLVRELAPLHLFRDRLTMDAIMAAGADRGWEASHLAQWLRRTEPDPSLGRWLLLFAALAILNVGLFAAHMLGFLPPWWQITLAPYVGLLLLRSRATDQAADEALALGGALRQMQAVFNRLETFSYSGRPQLRACCTPVLQPGLRPSLYLSRITRIVAAMGIRGNPLIRYAINTLVPWDHWFAYQLQRTRASLASLAPQWMDVWFELEALCSLANAAYLNPAYVLPEFLQSRVGGCDRQEVPNSFVYKASGLGHPLLPDDERVCNDFTINHLGQVAIITGSNMAGKSVLLKTIGVSLAMAYAGGPVAARRLQTLPFRLFTSMGISDSVTDGISYFYAEVKRLKTLLAELERSHPLPLLFCIDEIFRGTNNRERRIGSHAYVRALTGGRGVGLIATHDLELAALGDEVANVRNLHLRDEIIGDRMAFDYVLRPGPCPTTNAIRIMALEGLPVGT